SLESMIQTLAFNARLPVLLGASPFYQTPKAPIARGLTFAEEDFVRARLTALAIETDHFVRDDIYTLFVTTRIINFLKGLELDCSTDAASLLGRQWPHPRTQIGIELLARLWRDGRLYLWTREGMIENRRFRSELFRRVVLQAGEIGCQNGARIVVSGFGSRVLG
ncbi:MAG TPA: B12-binding domain-containing radical SAM protein, partial [Candidatus Binatia bacterium]|nr:B12-binding domain-containing radical SAM protein [Candidatus Binatia bacterium]